MRHIISILLENEPGALSRVVGLFSARGYNIETLTVAPTEDPSLSRMTIVSVGSEDVIEQITMLLNRLVEELGDNDGETDELGDNDADGLRLGDTEELGDSDADGLRLGDADDEGLALS